MAELPIDADELIALAMHKLSVTNGRQLADALGLEGRESDKRAARWIKGENKPDYDATVTLLSEVGLLRKKPVRRQARANGAAEEELLRRLAEAVERIEAALDGRQDAQGE